MGLFKKEVKPTINTLLATQPTEPEILRDLEDQLEHVHATEALLTGDDRWTILLRTLHDYLNHPSSQAYSEAATTFLEGHEDVADRYNETYPTAPTPPG